MAYIRVMCHVSILAYTVSLPLLQVIYNNGSAEFQISTNHTFTVSPEFISSRLLLKMRKMAERQLGVPIQKAVISVPAEFDERQRNYTVRAANLAGKLSRCCKLMLDLQVGQLTKLYVRQLSFKNSL